MIEDCESYEGKVQIILKENKNLIFWKQ